MPNESAPNLMTAEDAMQEIWSELCADCGPEDYDFLVEEVRKMKRYLYEIAPPRPGELPVWLNT